MYEHTHNIHVFTDAIAMYAANREAVATNQDKNPPYFF